MNAQRICNVVAIEEMFNHIYFDEELNEVIVSLHPHKIYVKEV